MHSILQKYIYYVNINKTLVFHTAIPWMSFLMVVFTCDFISYTLKRWKVWKGGDKK